MSDEVIGEIRLFAGDFAPRGWAKCDGSLLAISTNEALFSLLGTTYGGDGRTTFGLPDLRGRVPIGTASSPPPGLTQHPPGARGGQEAVALQLTQMPVHTHNVTCTAQAKLMVSTDQGSLQQPTDGAYLGEGFFQGASGSHLTESYASSGTPSVTLGGTSVGTTTTTVSVVGSNMSHENMQPSCAISYIIALVGVYPSRP